MTNAMPVTKESAIISQLQQDIINNTQKGFPLTSKPYLAIAKQLAHLNIMTCEHDVFDAVNALHSKGILSRVGPVFDHKKAGASTLAALAVPPKDLDKIAGIVNQFDQVNHNYGREHSYNLWFVVTANDMVALNSTIANIELLTGLPVLVLPMEASYHIDLAFSINITGIESPVTMPLSHNEEQQNNATIPLTDIEKQALRTSIERGLPEHLSPYQVIAEQLNLDEKQVITQIALWQSEGLIRRFGLVIKHRKLGYDANAMVVWNIPTNDMDKVALRLAKCAPVSLCYQRPRRLPDWPYNLFCMIHGTDRALVLSQIDHITVQLGLEAIEKDILFSFKAYKQHGARYGKLKNNIEKRHKIESSKFINSTRQGQAHG
jgi:DNA-binding Lrp family transcriptional regulator